MANYDRVREGDTTKVCSTCLNPKPLEHYEVRVSKRTGKPMYGSNCRRCVADNNRDRARKVRKEDPIGAWAGIGVVQSRLRAKQRNIPHALTVEDFLRLAKHPHCEYCGRELLFSQGKPSPQSPTIDRLVIAHGYVSDNVVLCCMRCNRIKNDATPEEMIGIAKKILQILEERQLLRKAG